MIDINKHLIDASANILEAFKKLNEVPQSLTLFVVNKSGVLQGTLTDGDIRRGFLKGLELSDAVEKFMAPKFHFLNDGEVAPALIGEIKAKGIRLLPVLDKGGKIKSVIDFKKVQTLLPVDAVLMAGGRGERLRPLTDTTPKPLLKVGEKPIIDHNLEHLAKFGIKTIYLTLRYLGEMIETHCGDGSLKDINIRYVYETEPLGTIGSVSLIKGYVHDHVLVMNADLFTNIDLEDFYQSFIEQNADMAVATVPYSIDVPYAVLNLNEDRVEGFHEKPTYTYHSNAGIYLIRRELLKTIPMLESYNATDFIQALITAGKKVIRFPIIGYWIDIGKPEDFQKVQEIAKHLRP
ncbi:MAG TPA: nucleotidyltransferase family protein [Bacteroidales bacterium]|nr:nucleotidyltransferase family protein [Bacteroidales bacterium]